MPTSASSSTPEVESSKCSSAAPSGLLCDLLSRPERGVIATRRPTFGWIVPTKSATDTQTAYQVRVAAAPDQLHRDNGNLLWDSGKVVSAKTTNIPYEGQPLDWGQSACWTVRIWTKSGGDSEWASVQGFTLAPHDTKESVSYQNLETKPIEPVLIRPLTEKSWFVDFGRAAFGWLELEFQNPQPGQIVNLRIGEAVKQGRVETEPPGSVRYEEEQIEIQADQKRYRVAMKPGPLNQREDAIKLPKQFPGVMPFRYLEIEVPNGELPAITQLRLQYTFDETAASFSSSSAELNEIWQLCYYSILATSFAGYYVDGDRERIPYEADAYINQLCHYATDREYSLARRTHEYLLRHPTWPTEWKQHSILIAWEDYQATGDNRSLSRNYELLRDEKLLLQYARPDGLLNTGELKDIVDWPLCERDDFDFRPVNTVINAFHYRTLVLMGAIADAISRPDDALEFQERAEKVLHTFNRIFWNEVSGLYVDGEGSTHASLHTNLFALAFDLIPAPRKASVIAWLKTRGMACSVYPAQFLLEGLFKNGEADYAIGLMTGGGLRSWRNMLDKGATITWEAWDQSFKPNQDWNHAWGAAPANIIPRFVLGLQPLEPGYGKIQVHPQLGPLTKAEGTIPTIHGPVHVKAWRTDKGVSTTVEAPANVLVTVVREEGI